MSDFIYIQVSVLYDNFNHFEQISNRLGAMDNIKAGVPRTAYKGIVTIWRHQKQVHIVPSSLFTVNRRDERRS
jgi:alpha-1,3-mannosyl-glycoprotein beta-1,2-N-acetylglucosaminyltransferase